MLLGFSLDDPRIPNARKEAKKKGIRWSFREEHEDGAHPNSARFLFKNESTSMEMVGASVGGGAVKLMEIDGFRLELSGDLPALITFHKDTPGVVASITGVLASNGLNIATLTLHRQGRGKGAAMVVELDENPSKALLSRSISGKTKHGLRRGGFLHQKNNGKSPDGDAAFCGRSLVF